jgi:hypothetical protein
MLRRCSEKAFRRTGETPRRLALTGEKSIRITAWMRNIGHFPTPTNPDLGFRLKYKHIQGVAIGGRRRAAHLIDRLRFDNKQRWAKIIIYFLALFYR